MQFYSAFEFITHYIPWPFSLMQDQHTSRIYIQDLKFPQRLYMNLAPHCTSPRQAATFLHNELCLYADLIPAWHGARKIVWS